ncbi:hypothetical protein [Pontibacter ruber]|uniref:Lipocalin-like domain-containing protein n=1 Tax=Pontibacter ruber TaxID=1343895 RepID=A0ABW5CU09_9BACT|nr:hypothetical protein [Pontibacter ruber]
MNTHRLRYLFAFFFSLILLTSCKDDKDEPTLTKTDILSAQEWHGDRVLLNGLDVSQRSEIIDMFLDIKSLRLQLKKDGSFTANYIQGGKAQTTTGKWSLSNDEAKINFEGIGELDIKTLSSDSFEMTASVEQSGRTYQGEVRLVK